LKIVGCKYVVVVVLAQKATVILSLKLNAELAETTILAEVPLNTNQLFIFPVV
jgi:hypothetical protein